VGQRIDVLGKVYVFPELSLKCYDSGQLTFVRDGTGKQFWHLR